MNLATIEQLNVPDVLRDHRKRLRYLEATVPGSSFPHVVNIDAELETKDGTQTDPNADTSGSAAFYGTEEGDFVGGFIQSTIIDDPGTGDRYQLRGDFEIGAASCCGNGWCKQVSTDTVYLVYLVRAGADTFDLLTPGTDPGLSFVMNAVTPAYPFSFTDDDIVFDGMFWFPNGGPL